MIGSAIAAIILFFLFMMQVENRAISYEEAIENTRGDIRVEEKRRFDLIPNLVECVKQYDLHEYNTLKDVIAARNSNTASNPASNVDEIKAAINVVAERYPDLKSQKNYQDLMNELSITENKISQMRKHYNKNVTDYYSYSDKQSDLVLLNKLKPKAKSTISVKSLQKRLSLLSH